MLQNANPVIHDQIESKRAVEEYLKRRAEANPDDIEEFDALEVYELLRNINDPEHPLTLEQLNIITIDNIKVSDKDSSIDIMFTPTIPHCSLATIIGLMIRVKLIRSLPMRFKVDIKITPGAHQQETAINKQLADKERIAAALENTHILDVVNRCLTTTGYQD